MEFLKNNAVKLGLVVIVLAAAAVILFSSGGKEHTLANTVTYVCVESGEFFELERKPRIPPVENPKTGLKTLVPCSRHADGSATVSNRMSSVIEQLEKTA